MTRWDRPPRRGMARALSRITGSRVLEAVQAVEAASCFTLVDFHVIEPGRLHFQSLTMRRPA